MATAQEEAAPQEAHGLVEVRQRDGSLSLVSPHTTEMPCSAEMKDVPLPPGGADLIQRTLASGKRAFIVVTGAGAQYLSWLMDTPGVSSFLLETVVPYSKDSLDAFMYPSPAPEHYVDHETALMMADEAFRRAFEMSAKRSPVVIVDVVGVSLTATIKTKQIKSGMHHAHMIARTCHEKGGGRGMVYAAHLVLDKDKRTRFAEDFKISEALLKLVAHAVGAAPPPELDLEFPGDNWEFSVTETETPVLALPAFL
eukprot:TRINITY_DN5759_c0_g1_i1.p1 TRINITY_DN5759_c0_g1~~TRINITY_DN5759_c0_g1_i1.p1  ORF type:complete len:254 (-),score=71.87 TRINITY_DN5759_c0_g1_i1:198-959(-)